MDLAGGWFPVGARLLNERNVPSAKFGQEHARWAISAIADYRALHCCGDTDSKTSKAHAMADNVE